MSAPQNSINGIMVPLPRAGVSDINLIAPDAIARLSLSCEGDTACNKHIDSLRAATVLFKTL
jgi:hypothetical protein